MTNYCLPYQKTRDAIKPSITTTNGVPPLAVHPEGTQDGKEQDTGPIVKVHIKRMISLRPTLASSYTQKRAMDFHSGSVIKNLPSSVEQVGSIAGQEVRIHMFQGN